MTPPGDIRAYDVLTGKLLWQFHIIPRPGEFGYETNPPDGYKYIGGANNWGEMSIDEARGIVYIPTGSATADFYGGDRPGQNLFANCLLALDVRTGKRLWHFQTVHHDLWDLDNVSAPQLVTVTHNGKKVDVVAHAGKTGLPVRVRPRHRHAALADRGTAGRGEPGAVREVVADAAVPDQAGAVRAAVVHRGRREPVAADAGGVRGAQGAGAQGEERQGTAGRPLQPDRAQRRQHLDARQPGRLELGDHGGRSAARPRLRHQRQPGGAAPPQRRQGSAGRAGTGRWRRRSGRRGRVERRAGAPTRSTAWRVTAPISAAPSPACRRSSA